MEAIATSQHVSINSSTPGAYNVVCNKCIPAQKFTYFDDFLDHCHAEHGPTVRRSAISIVPEDTLISARGSVSHLSTLSCVSTTFTGSSLSNNLSTNSADEFDLHTLKRQCMLDIIELLNKCFCIWHRPTRETVPRSERLHAYQLVLMKLREHMPFVTFRDARSIVRQIIRSYLRKQRLSEGDGVSRKSRVNVDQLDDDADDWQMVRQLDAIKSRGLLDRLNFLQGCDGNDVEELISDKLCAFCNIGFHNTETLWTHMVSAHLPASKQKRSRSVTTDSMATESTVDALSLSRKRPRSRMSRSTFESHTDGEQHSYSGSEPSCLRRSRRRRRGISRNGQRMRSRNKVVGLKRIRQRRQSPANSGGDDTSVASQPSTFYLADYSDKFLEEFIDLYRQQECLWQRDSRTYRNRKIRAAAYDALLKKYCQSRKVPSVSINKIKSLIRRMRNYYDRLKRPNANPYRSHIWQRLCFIEQCPTMPVRRRSHNSDTCKTDYDCSVCLRRFKRAKSYASHMLKTHPPTECPPCSETFNNADELVRHLRFIHRKDAKCPLCKEGENVWKSSEHLNMHFFEHRCPTCAEIFYDAINFRRHRAKCRNINRFHCKHCTSKFTSTMDFRRHTKATHQDERPFKCEDCGITFKYLAPLAKHRRQHHFSR